MTYSGRVSVFADSVAVILAFVVATAVSFVALVVGGDGVRPAVAVSLQIVYVPTRLVESACVGVCVFEVSKIINKRWVKLCHLKRILARTECSLILFLWLASDATTGLI